MLEGLLTEANIIDYIDMRLVILLLCILSAGIFLWGAA